MIDNKGASGHQQIITSARLSGVAGEIISIPVSCNTSDGNAGLAGLGLRIHFDNTKLTWLVFEDVLTRDLLLHHPISDSGDFDGDGQVRPLTDGLLTMRYLFGFRGNALTQVVTGASGQCVTATCSEQALGQMSAN